MGTEGKMVKEEMRGHFNSLILALILNTRLRTQSEINTMVHYLSKFSKRVRD